MRLHQTLTLCLFEHWHWCGYGYRTHSLPLHFVTIASIIFENADLDAKCEWASRVLSHWAIPKKESCSYWFLVILQVPIVWFLHFDLVITQLKISQISTSPILSHNVNRPFHINCLCDTEMFCVFSVHFLAITTYHIYIKVSLFLPHPKQTCYNLRIDINQ